MDGSEEEDGAVVVVVVGLLEGEYWVDGGGDCVRVDIVGEAFLLGGERWVDGGLVVGGWRLVVRRKG